LTVAVVLPFGLWDLVGLSETMVEKTALEGAAQQSELLREMNKLYSDVATRAERAGVETTHLFPLKEDTIPIPARFTILLGERMQKLEDVEDRGDRQGHRSMRVLLYSNYPFREREDSPPKHSFGRKALIHFARPENKDLPYYVFEKSHGVQVLRYATPLLMNERCISCHNNKARYPALKKTDWKPGDVRGVLEIIHPLGEDLEQTRHTLIKTYLVVGGVASGVLALCWLIVAIERRRRRA
jgi:adenylate cyclase